MTGDPLFVETLRLASRQSGSRADLNPINATGASPAQEKCENARVWTVSNTPRYGTAKNGPEVRIKRGVSPYRPIEKRYDRYGSSGGRPKGLSRPGFDLELIRPGQRYDTEE